MASCVETKQTGAGDAANKQQVQLEPFSSHMALMDAGSLQCTLRVLKMNGSTLIFVSGKESERINEFAVAMPARAPSKEIVATTFMGESGQSESLVLATKLSTRYNRQFYVSFNLALDAITRPLLEKALVDYMQQNLKLFV